MFSNLLSTLFNFKLGDKSLSESRTAVGAGILVAVGFLQANGFIPAGAEAAAQAAVDATNALATGAGEVAVETASGLDSIKTLAVTAVEAWGTFLVAVGVRDKLPN